ncbi:hypothetical protein I3760_04G040800 [Carya illinoinensis]|nr:hypothetical protein I3760_04G040800 [Carya illinoinensis]
MPHSSISRTDTTNVELYYECGSMYIIPVQPDSFQFTCTRNGNSFTNYYKRSNEDCVYNNVEVPVMQSAVSGNLSTQAALSEAIDGGFTLGWNANDSRCDGCEVSGGQCGFNTSTNAFVCHCKTGSSPLTCESTRTSDGANNSSMCERCIGSGGHCGFDANTNAFVCHCTTGSSPFTCESTGLAGVVLFSFVIVCFVKRGCLSNNSMVWRKRDAKNHDHFNAEEVLKNFGSMVPKRYTYSEVKKLTNSFKDKVGHGGYGVVYKGKLADGRIVAVKVLGKSNDNGGDFINEVASISRTSHVNIVTFLGFCYERTKRALIYEFVSNGSLDKFIYNKVSSITKSQLDCKTMFKIALGIARGLEYLHRGCRTRILHFDIKPHNILLDEDLCPKISDFGLAKLCKTKESIVSMTGMRGTPGYIAPEVFRRCFGGVSHKSDVYSYGMLVLDMVGERKRRVGSSGVSHSSEIYFPDCIYDKLEQDRKGFRSNSEGITSRPEEEDMLQKMIVVSLWCIQTNPSERPSMGKVIEMLEGTLQSLQLPPKPSVNSPTILSAQDSSTTLQPLDIQTAIAVHVEEL